MTNNRGFTLIEVLIAMAIFSIGILAVGLLQIHSINLNASARMQTEATTVAVEWLERLRAVPYDHPDLIEDTLQDSQAGSFTVQWQVTEDLDWPIKTITVTVNSANPNLKSVSVSTKKGQET